MSRKPYKCQHKAWEVCPMDERFMQCSNPGCSSPTRARRLIDPDAQEAATAPRAKARARQYAKNAAVKAEVEAIKAVGGLFADLIPPLEIPKKRKGAARAE